MTSLGTFIITIGEILGAVLIIVNVLKKTRKKALDSLLKEVKGEISSLKDEISIANKDREDVKLSILRLEILSLIANDPTNHETIYKTFDEYKNKGGNHYIESVIRRWEKEQGLN